MAGAKLAGRRAQMQVKAYDRVAAWLHWLVALLVLAQFATGWGWSALERGSDPRMVLFRIHIGMGIAILVLAVLRLAWRATHPAPELPAGMSGFTRLASRATHVALYALILVQPVLGLLTITALGKSLGRWPRDLHMQLVNVIAAIVALHVAAALWHQLVRRDGLMARMNPFAQRAALGLAAGLAVVPMTPAEAQEVRLTDIMGREVMLAQPARRMMIDDGRYLIALSLLTDDPVALLSAWPRDINRIGPAVYEQYRAKFPAIETLPQVASSAGAFSVEQALAAAPDLAVFSLNAQPEPAQIAQLEAAGIPVVVVDFFQQPLANLEPSLRILARAIGEPDAADAFIAFRAARLADVTGRLSGLTERPKVFIEPHAARTDECCPSPGRGNIGNYVSLAGGANIGEGAIAGAVGVLGLEYVIASDPDVYIATGGPHMQGTAGLLIGPGYDAATVQATLARVAGRDGIAGLRAVREKRVHGIAHQLLNSPLDILTVEALAKWIHPALFSDIDLEATRTALNGFLAVPLDGIYWADLD
jgi:iron complex transport system substrate-binding protein